MKYTDEDLINEVQKADNEVEGTVTYTYFSERDGPSTKTVENRFGQWTTAKRKAGVDNTERYGKRPVNSDYFEKIDSSEKAYWLGVLYGDGSIITYEPNDRVYLAMVDEEHVEKFQDTLDASQSVLSQKDGTYCITITDQKLANDLAELGCDGDKTFSDSLPNLSDKTRRAAFVRGLFDADGNYRNRGDGFCITGAESGRFSQLIEWLPSDGVVKSDDEVNRLYVFQHHGVFDLWNWLYPDGSETAPALERKLKQIPTNG